MISEISLLLLICAARGWPSYEGGSITMCHNTITVRRQNVLHQSAFSGSPSPVPNPRLRMPTTQCQEGSRDLPTLAKRALLARRVKKTAEAGIPARARETCVMQPKRPHSRTKRTIVYRLCTRREALPTFCHWKATAKPGARNQWQSDNTSLWSSWKTFRAEAIASAACFLCGASSLPASNLSH